MPLHGRSRRDMRRANARLLTPIADSDDRSQSQCVPLGAALADVGSEFYRKGHVNYPKPDQRLVSY